MSQFSVKWIYILDQNYKWESGFKFQEGHAFEDQTGKRRLKIHPNGEIKVLAGYAWDGCTPKFAVWDVHIGTPDGVPNAHTKKPKTYYASLLHDALYQFLDAELPLSRAEVDRVFLRILQRDNFGPRWIYYVAVRVFGDLSRRFTRWKRQHRGHRVPL
jgi:hypothetical protein